MASHSSIRNTSEPESYEENQIGTRLGTTEVLLAMYTDVIITKKKKTGFAFYQVHCRTILKCKNTYDSRIPIVVHALSHERAL